MHVNLLVLPLCHHTQIHLSVSFTFTPLPTPHSLWDLSSQTRDWTRAQQWECGVLTAGQPGNPLDKANPLASVCLSFPVSSRTSLCIIFPSFSLSPGSSPLVYIYWGHPYLKICSFLDSTTLSISCLISNISPTEVHPLLCTVPGPQKCPINICWMTKLVNPSVDNVLSKATISFVSIGFALSLFCWFWSFPFVFFSPHCICVHVF